MWIQPCRGSNHSIESFYSGRTVLWPSSITSSRNGITSLLKRHYYQLEETTPQDPGRELRQVQSRNSKQISQAESLTTQ